VEKFIFCDRVESAADLLQALTLCDLGDKNVSGVRHTFTGVRFCEILQGITVFEFHNFLLLFSYYRLVSVFFSVLSKK
jgi:hypothetical protein